MSEAFNSICREYLFIQQERIERVTCSIILGDILGKDCEVEGY